MLAVVVAAADTALRALRIYAIDVVVGIEESVGVVTRMAVVLIEGAETVVFVQHIVHLQLWRPALPHTRPLLIAATEVEVGAYVIGKVVLLQRLPVTVAACPQRGGNVESARSVVHVEVVGQRVAVLVDEAGVILETESFTLRLLQRDADYGLHRGCIAGTRVVDDIHVLYLVGAQTRELAHVLHPSAVDIHLGIATSQHLDGSVALCLQ